MEIEWIATDPESGLLSPVETRSSVDEYVSRINVLLGRGEGFSQVHLAGEDYPLLSFRFRNSYGVVDRFAPDGTMHILRGNGVVPANDDMFFPGLEGDSQFSGEYILSADRAWREIAEFLSSGSVSDPNQWDEL